MEITLNPFFEPVRSLASLDEFLAGSLQDQLPAFVLKDVVAAARALQHVASAVDRTQIPKCACATATRAAASEQHDLFDVLDRRNLKDNAGYAGPWEQTDATLIRCRACGTNWGVVSETRETSAAKYEAYLLRPDCSMRFPA